MVQWSKAPGLGLSPGSVAAGHDREAHGAAHIWPSVVWVREGLAGRDILVSSYTSDPCGGPGAVHADTVSVYGVSSYILVRLASGLDRHCVKKQCSLVGLCFRGRVALDLRLSQVRTVAVMRQDCNYYQLDTTKLWRKKEVKIQKKNVAILIHRFSDNSHIKDRIAFLSN